VNVQRCRVLLVDDEVIIRLSLAAALADAGCDVTEAGTADQARPMLDHPDAFDALVTDVQMPGRLDGIGLAEDFRTRHPRAPVVFMTGRPECLDQHGALDATERLLVKPFQPEEAVSALRSALDATERR
jgi:two-component system, response regulator PdtaR